MIKLKLYIVMLCCILGQQVVFAQDEYSIFKDKSFNLSLSHQLGKSNQAGNSRDISNVNLLLPLKFKQDILFFTNLIYMRDFQHNQEYNIGLGIRYIYPQYLVGSYVFFDRRFTQYNTNVSQMTFGVELLASMYEFRTNFYLPISRMKTIGHSQQQVESSSLKMTTVSVIKGNLIVTPLSGIDLEALCHAPFYRDLSMSAGYYHFTAQGVSELNGIRFKADLKLASWIKIFGEYTYDRVRNSIGYFGLTLSFKHQAKQFTRMPTKKLMDAPVRDLDIVVRKGEIPREVNEFTFEPELRPYIAAMTGFPTSIV